MDAKPYTSEEIERIRGAEGYKPNYERRWLATVDAARAEVAAVKDMHARILAWPPVDVEGAYAVVAQMAASLARADPGTTAGVALLRALDSIKMYVHQREAEADELRQQLNTRPEGRG